MAGNLSISGSSLPKNSKERFHFHSHLKAAKTPAQLKTAIVNALETLGLDSFSFVPVGVEGPRRLSNWPDELQEAYNQRIECDLIAKHAGSQMQPIYLAEIVDYVRSAPLDLEANSQFLELCELAAGHGLLDSYNIPQSTPMDVNCLFSVSKLGMEPTEFHAWVEDRLDRLFFLGDLIANMTFAHYATYFFGVRAFSRKTGGITPKQLQLLEWLAKHNGTLRDAAKALHISVDTANKHIAAVKAALGANTQASAVYRGIVAGLIEVDATEWG